jgi:hypothetical protein
MAAAGICLFSGAGIWVFVYSALVPRSHKFRLQRITLGGHEPHVTAATACEPRRNHGGK